MDPLADVESMEEKMKKLEKDHERDLRFAMEANDILRSVWNMRLLKGNPKLEGRLANLLGVKPGELA